MENQTDIIEYLLDKLLIKFEESFPLLPNYLIIVKVQEIKKRKKPMNKLFKMPKMRQQEY